MCRYQIVCLFLLLSTSLCYAQGRVRKSERPAHDGKALLLQFGYGAYQPAANLADRFGLANGFSVAPEYWLASNWSFGLNGQLYFGNTVEEDPLSNLKTRDGDIIGNNRGLAMYVLRQRGHHIGVHAGKLIVLGRKRSGISIKAGIGYMTHWIRVQDDGQSMVQIVDDYIKGYDRKTGGISTRQFIGYQHIPLHSGMTWFAGFESEQGFTKSLRSWDFGTKQADTQNRTDIRLGFKIGIALPFFFVNDSSEIIY